MGGVLSLAIAVSAALAFMAAGRVAMAFVAAAVGLLCLWSWLHMRYFARRLAKQRQYVAALGRGEFEEGSPEAQRCWRTMRVEVESRDAADVPEWITRVNFVAFLLALILAIWGGIAYWK
jgi:hypothetical protein